MHWVWRPLLVNKERKRPLKCVLDLSSEQPCRKASITRSTGDHLQGRQDNASLSLSRPFWPSKNYFLEGWGMPGDQPQQELAQSQSSGPWGLRGLPYIPRYQWYLPLPQCGSVVPQHAPGHAPSRTSQNPLGPLYLSAISHPLVPLNQRIGLAWFAERQPKYGEGEKCTPPTPLRGPFPHGQATSSSIPRETPLGGVRTQPWANLLSVRPQGCRNTNGYTRVPASGHQGRGLVREWSDWTILPFLQCHLNPRATLHLGTCQLNCPEHLHNGPQSGVVEGKSRRAEPAQATGHFWEFAPAAVVIW